MGTFANSAGLGVNNHYGARTTDESFGGQESTCAGLVKSAVWQFEYNKLPAPGTTNMQYSIPANSTIVSAKLYIDVAFTSTSTTTDLLIGLQKADGTEIDNDGLVTAANATQTTIAVANSVITGSGDLVGKTIGAAAGELVVAGSADDLLTGAARLVVEYVKDR